MTLSIKPTKMRKQLSAWQLEVEARTDRRISFSQSVLAAMQQLQTEAVTILNSGKNITLASATEGASIGYQIDDAIGSERWLLYHQPIQLKKAKNSSKSQSGYKISDEYTNGDSYAI